MSWTDERVETLKKMWAEGQSASQIAKELGGVTRNAVIGKVHRLGLSNRVGAGNGRDDGDEAEAPAAAAPVADPPPPRVEPVAPRAEPPRAADPAPAAAPRAPATAPERPQPAPVAAAPTATIMPLPIRKAIIPPPPPPCPPPPPPRSSPCRSARPSSPPVNPCRRSLPPTKSRPRLWPRSANPSSPGAPRRNPRTLCADPRLSF